MTDTWPLNKAARYVAVAGFFRSDEDSQWKIAFDANSLRKDGIWFSSDGVRVLADFYSVQAVRGMDVLNTPKGQEPAAVANPPAAPVIPKPISDMATAMPRLARINISLRPYRSASLPQSGANIAAVRNVAP